MKKFFLTTVLVFIGALVFAQQTVVAVAPFEVISGITQADANVVTGVFYNRLGNANVVTLVDRSIVERVIREHQFQLSDWSRPEKTAELGEALNADWIVRGKIEKLGTNIIVNVQFYDINTFQFKGGADIPLANVNEAYNKMTPLVDSLVQTIRDTVQLVPAGLEYEVYGRSVIISKYTGNAVNLKISAQIQGLPVTGIGERAFRNCESLISIIIPSSVTSIGGFAFSGCSSLTSITIPSSVTSIRDSAFSGCSSLTSITIPSSVTSIGDSAFSGCSSLTSITIPSSVTSIGNSAFADCSSLTSIAIPSSLTSISDYLFFKCSSLTSINIPSSVTSIGDSAFVGCSSLTSIAIPSSVTSIENFAFAVCESLTSITIPSSVTSIGWNAFASCSRLTSINIPSSVTEIGGGAFFGCISLTSVTISRRTRVGEDTFPSNVRITYRD